MSEKEVLKRYGKNRIAKGNNRQENRENSRCTYNLPICVHFDTGDCKPDVYKGTDTIPHILSYMNLV